MAPKEYKYLTQDQVDGFLQYGYVRIPGAFTKEKAEAWTAQMWPRLGYDPADKSTWLQDRVHMPNHTREHVSTFAPKAWGAMGELLGGNIDPDTGHWSDGFIVNLGTEEWERNPPLPADLDNWHVDGDFFVHFLDSPEQGLLVIPIFSDIAAGGGGTMITPDGIAVIAKQLMQHPEGVSPRMVPVGEDPEYTGLGWFINKVRSSCDDFHEMTGKIGDVVLMHPLMLHSASRNSLRIPRVITNPLISAKRPFNFDRENPDEYSLVERKTLRALGVQRLQGWKITGDRAVVVPERLRLHAAMKEAEEKRLRGELVGGTNVAGTVIHEVLQRTVKA